MTNKNKNKNKNLYKIKLFNQISLSENCKSVVLGSLLGNGSLKKYSGYPNAIFSIRHSLLQKDYMLWKMGFLKEVHNPSSLILQQPTGFSQNQKLLYQSQSHEELTKIYDLTYKYNKLLIKRKWLNHLTPLSLAIWWLDDGSLISNKKQGVLCTDGFERKQVDLLSRYLLKVWNIKTKVRNVRRVRDSVVKEYPRLWISTCDMRKFIDIIKDFVPESMKYKIQIK